MLQYKSLALSVLVATAATARADGPIRVVLVGHPNVATYKENIQMSSEACRIVKGMPPAPAKLPSDDYLAKLAVIEDEQLFDGSKWAHYETQRSVWADGTAGCAIRLFVARAVAIEDTCTSTLRASTALMGELVDLEHPSMEPPSFAQEADERTTCKRPRKHAAVDLDGLPRADAGKGVACVWWSQVMAKQLAKAGMKPAPSKPEEFDMCVYAKRPELVDHGVARQIVVKIKAPMISQTGRDISTIFGEAKGSNQELSEFSDGTAIPASRFTAAAAKAFVAQPTRTAL